MTRSNLLCASSLSLLLAVGSFANAEVIYGFNSPTLNGFSNPLPSYDQDGTATVTQSLTTGKTEGTGALHINVAPTGGGYDQVDVETTTVPADLVAPATSSLSLDATANYGNASYITVAPEFFINGTTDGTGGTTATTIGTKLLFGSKTLSYDTGTTPVTETYALLIKDPYATAHNAGNPVTGTAATPADGDSTTTLYTPGHIVAQLLAALQAANPNATASISAFGIEETTNTLDGSLPPTATDFGDDLYVDNVTVPLPEPASLSALTLGGMLLTRRRAP